MMSFGVPPLSLSAQLTLSVAALALVAFIIKFQRGQKGVKSNEQSSSEGSAKMGGALSTAKALWLLFALYFWFIFCPTLGLSERCPSPWRECLLLFSANIWLRGVIELYMLYITKSWRPRYGITHDLFSLALIPFPLWGVELAPSVASSWGLISALTVLVLWLSMVLETLYAVWFNQIVEGKTTGDEGIWFADAESPQFKRVNRFTALNNLWLYVCLIVGLIAAWGGLQ